MIYVIEKFEAGKWPPARRANGQLYVYPSFGEANAILNVLGASYRVSAYAKETITC
jgi:hypothetical protein